MSGSALGQFEWKEGGKEGLAGYWSLFLHPKFRVRKWIVVLSESKADVFAPMADLKKTFLLVVLMSLWVVLLLSISQIRRSLVPLERLQEGAERVAKRDFDSRVSVTSGNEFEELATSFNTMAGQSGGQLHALSTMGEIGRAILAALDTGKIVETLLTRMPDVLPCDCVSVSLRGTGEESLARAYVRDGGDEDRTQEKGVEILPEEIQGLHENTESLLLTGEDLPHYPAPPAERGIGSVLVLPVFLKERVSAIIALGHRTPHAHSQDDVLQAQRLASQVGVALSNAYLIEELAKLNWGTLRALARAIDAKSTWTAGHSERVTELALRIGWTLGLRRKTWTSCIVAACSTTSARSGCRPRSSTSLGCWVRKRSTPCADTSASERGFWNPSPRMPRSSLSCCSITSGSMETGIPMALRERPSLWAPASSPWPAPMTP